MTSDDDVDVVIRPVGGVLSLFGVLLSLPPPLLLQWAGEPVEDLRRHLLPVGISAEYTILEVIEVLY